VVHAYHLERVRGLHIPRRLSSNEGAPFPSLTVHTLTHKSLHTSEQAAPVKVRPDPVERSPDPLVPAFQAGMIVPQEVLLQRLRDDHAGDRVAILVHLSRRWTVEQQAALVHLVVVRDSSAELSVSRRHLEHVSSQVSLQIGDPLLLVLRSHDSLTPHSLHNLFL
jgi:hypothetical protein